MAIVRRLKTRGVRVRTFSRSRYPELEAPGVEQVSGDIADPEAVSSACRDVEAVFHVAAKAGVWGRFDDFYAANVAGTRNIIAACRRHGVKRLIYTSSPSVVFHGGDMEGADESVPYPSNFHAAYPRTKALAEQAVLQAATDGLPSIILRPHLIWGPEDNHLVPRILARAKRLKQVGDGRNRVDTIYIDNAAQAHILAEQCLYENPALSGRVYFISQDEPIHLWEMVNAILAAGGLPPVRGRISPSAAYAVGACCEWIYNILKITSEPPMTRFVARELATSHWFDIGAAKRDLGYRPEVTTAEGLRRLKEWLKRTCKLHAA